MAAQSLFPWRAPLLQTKQNTHSMRRAKAVLIYRRTKNLWAVQTPSRPYQKIDSELLRYQAELSYVPQE
jgi:hypothetical protein